MSQATQPDPQVVACPQCAAPPGVPCRTSGVGHARRPHESREVAALRAFLKRYARTAPTRPDATTGGTPTDTEEPQP